MLRKLITTCLLLLCTRTTFALTPLSQDPAVQAFINHMVLQYHCNRAQLKGWLDQTKIQPLVTSSSSKPYEEQPWYVYRDFFLKPDRIEQGAAFWRLHPWALKRASVLYGVPPEIIVAIIGVESNYGVVLGKYRVIDALATLGFNPTARSKFFQNELSEYLLYCIENHHDPMTLYGSYAGAIGEPQFMPSSIRKWAVDFDHRGSIDIIHNPDDAIGSVANYFKQHGWHSDEPIAVLADVSNEDSKSLLNDGKKQPLSTYVQYGIAPITQIDDESLPVRLLALKIKKGTQYWFAFHNFDVIMTYNNSQDYALAVTLLAEAIKAKYQQSISSSH